MKGEFKKTLTVTKNEQEMISIILDIMEEVFGLDFEENPRDLVDIIEAISMESPRAYLAKGTMELKYQDE